MLELAVKLEYEPLIQFFMSKGALHLLKAFDKTILQLSIVDTDYSIHAIFNRSYT